MVSFNADPNIEVENVPVSDEEVAALVLAFKKAKLAKIKEIAYWDKVRKSTEPPVMSTKEYGIFMLQRAKEMLPEFSIDDQNRAVFKLLCQYFNNDPEFEKSEGMSLQKGIILYGPIGCGKTSLMRLFQTNFHNSFIVRSCREVADDYSDKDFGGSAALDYYSNLVEIYPSQNYGQTQAGFCFDDLGTENIKKHFGNEINALENVLLNRYDKRLFKKTHLTTNLNADGINEVYGSRVRSRLREMCNLISFEENASDRRR